MDLVDVAPYFRGVLLDGILPVVYSRVLEGGHRSQRSGRREAQGLTQHSYIQNSRCWPRCLKISSL